MRDLIVLGDVLLDVCVFSLLAPRTRRWEMSCYTRSLIIFSQWEVWWLWRSQGWSCGTSTPRPASFCHWERLSRIVLGPFLFFLDWILNLSWCWTIKLQWCTTGGVGITGDISKVMSPTLVRRNWSCFGERNPIIHVWLFEKQKKLQCQNMCQSTDVSRKSANHWANDWGRGGGENQSILSFLCSRL